MVPSTEIGSFVKAAGRRHCGKDANAFTTLASQHGF